MQARLLRFNNHQGFEDFLSTSFQLNPVDTKTMKTIGSTLESSRSSTRLKHFAPLGYPSHVANHSSSWTRTFLIGRRVNPRAHFDSIWAACGILLSTCNCNFEPRSPPFNQHSSVQFLRFNWIYDVHIRSYKVKYNDVNSRRKWREFRKIRRKQTAR